MKKILILVALALGLIVSISSCSISNPLAPKSCVLVCDDSIPPNCQCE